MFQSTIPILQVSSSAAAEEFYCKGLGFTLLSSYRPDNSKADPCYMTLARDDARLHVQSFQSGITGAGAVYVYVDDVDALYTELMAKGIQVDLPPTDQTWGMREIILRDPDRNVLTIGRRQASD